MSLPINSCFENFVDEQNLSFINVIVPFLLITATAADLFSAKSRALKTWLSFSFSFKSSLSSIVFSSFSYLIVTLFINDLNLRINSVLLIGLVIKPSNSLILIFCKFFLLISRFKLIKCCFLIFLRCSIIFGICFSAVSKSIIIRKGIFRENELLLFWTVFN